MSKSAKYLLASTVLSAATWMAPRAHSQSVVVHCPGGDITSSNNTGGFVDMTCPSSNRGPSTVGPATQPNLGTQRLVSPFIPATVTLGNNETMTLTTNRAALTAEPTAQLKQTQGGAASNQGGSEYGHWETREIEKPVYVADGCNTKTGKTKYRKVGTKKTKERYWVKDQPPAPRAAAMEAPRPVAAAAPVINNITQVIEQFNLQIKDTKLALGTALAMGDYADNGLEFQKPGFGVGLAALIYDCVRVVLEPAVVVTKLPFRGKDRMHDENQYIHEKISRHLTRYFAPEVLGPATKKFYELGKAEDKAVKKALHDGGPDAARKAAESFAPEYLAAMRNPVYGAAFRELCFNVLAEANPALLFTAEGGTIVTEQPGPTVPVEKQLVPMNLGNGDTMGPQSSSDNSAFGPLVPRAAATTSVTDVTGAFANDRAGGRERGVRLGSAEQGLLGTDREKENRERDAAAKRNAVQP